MTLPSAVTKTHIDSASDDPAQARSELATMADAINSLITHLGTSSLTSGSSVLAAALGLAVSGTSLITAFTFSTKTATYTVTTTDRAKVVNWTTAGCDADFTAAATLGDGWWCIVRNSASSGDLNLDPNSTESINGSSTSIALGPGEMAVVTCNGTALFAHIMRAFATQTEMEAAASLVRMVSPADMKWHPGALKGFAHINAATGAVPGTPDLLASLNVSSITDNGAGDMTINWATDFSSGNYSVTFGKSAGFVIWDSQTAGGVRIRTYTTNVVQQDFSNITVHAAGDH